MTYPKMKPCPRCGDPDVRVYSYDNGWRHVECDSCVYLGPGEGNVTQAIRSHNAYAKAFPASAILPPAIARKRA